MQQDGRRTRLFIIKREALPLYDKQPGRRVRNHVEMPCVPAGCGKNKIGETDAMFRAIPCTDHTGHTFPSTKDMLAAYGLTWSAWRGRNSKGWDLETILTTPLEDNSVTDHLGNRYKSKRAMATAYGMEPSVLNERLRAGWSVKKALTEPVMRSTPVTDHKGIQYKNSETMAAAYGLSKTCFHDRISKGMDLRTALEGPAGVTDHKGNTYPSERAMCLAYGTSQITFHRRLDAGMSIQEALEAGNGPKAEKCLDHNGTEYPSRTAMCSAYGISPATYLDRIASGWTKEQALTTKNGVTKSCSDWGGRMYASVMDLAGSIGVTKQQFYTQYRKTRDYPSASENACVRYWPGTDAGSFRVRGCIAFPWFLCEDMNETSDEPHAGELVMHADTIQRLKSGKPIHDTEKSHKVI